MKDDYQRKNTADAKLFNKSHTELGKLTLGYVIVTEKQTKCIYKESRNSFSNRLGLFSQQFSIAFCELSFLLENFRLPFTVVMIRSRCLSQ